jgi:hypothetical protein
VPVSLALLLAYMAVALPAPAYAQWWISEMPSEREVVAKIQGEDTLDSLARQHAAFDRLRFVMGKMLRDREFDPTPPQERLLATYRAGPTGAAAQAMAASPSSEARKEWFARAFEYAADDAFRAEVMKAFFSKPGTSGSSAAGGAEPVLAPVVAGRRQLVHHAGLGRHEGNEQELRDPVADRCLEPRVAQVDEHDADLAAVVGVDQAGAVDD